MGLSNDEEKIWEAAIKGLDDPTVDLTPIRLPVPGFLGSSVQLWDAIDRARKQDILSADEFALAREFFATVLASPNADDIIAELNYEQEKDGPPFAILQLPHPGGDVADHRKE